MKKIILVALIIALGVSYSFSNNINTIVETCDTCTTKSEEESLKCLLTGEWTFTGYAIEIIDNIHNCGDFITANGAHLTFEFNADGTFTKTFGSDTQEVVENGTWEVSNDLSQLVLYGNETNFIQLNTVENEKIELNLNIQENGLANFFCTEMNILTFNKNIMAVKNPLLR